MIDIFPPFALVNHSSIHPSISVSLFNFVICFERLGNRQDRLRSAEISKIHSRLGTSPTRIILVFFLRISYFGAVGEALLTDSWNSDIGGFWNLFIGVYVLLLSYFIRFFIGILVVRDFICWFREVGIWGFLISWIKSGCLWRRSLVTGRIWTSISEVLNAVLSWRRFSFPSFHLE